MNRTITLLMATMLLMVAGVKTWSLKEVYGQEKQVSGPDFHASDAGDASGEKGSQGAVISSLSLDAVITPALSFDFFQGFYILPEPLWQLISDPAAAFITFEEPYFLVSSFCRIFGSYIVTNAP
ncbi:hypothetical protein DYBT9275_04435 [Dyadobacter sp. CECT 9275]|uniref:Uncharacterized protein n=1 Tax=Dyadobacter helix TaxID=2822344 RepID=A0A916JF93_9BACT|nr:hypothetical protein [Dyadobacter sp. CECT 9275]CAG5009160.1 hypothetical protein DYBT9275_04435 [Dyadobacter sp. CECT 9275]